MKSYIYRNGLFKCILVMVTVMDVFQHIAQDLRSYSDKDQFAAAEEFLVGTNFDFSIAITTDVEETQLDFLVRYGTGHSFFFRLADHEHGKLLAGQMFWILRGERPDMSAYKGLMFKPADKLYLFVQLRNVDPPQNETMADQLNPA